MKKKFLIASIVLNFAMCLFLVRIHLRTDANSSQSKSEGNIPLKKETERPPIEPTNESMLTWLDIRSEDYDIYVRNLIRLQCPEKTIAVIIVSEVNEHFRHLATNLLSEAQVPTTFAYWRGNSFENEHRAATVRYKERLAILNSERVKFLKRLVGDIPFDEGLAWAPSPVSVADLRKSIDYLPIEKRGVVRKFLDDTNDQLRQLVAKGGGAELQVEMERIKSDLVRKVSTVLTIEEKDMFELRTSPIAHTMGDEFAGVELSEAEFKALFELRKKAEESLTKFESSSYEDKQRGKISTLSSLDNDTKTVLGDERYNEFMRLQTREYRNALSFVEKNEMPKSTALDLYNIELVAKGNADRVRSDQLIDATARQQILNRIKEETEQELHLKLGATGYQNYSANYRANWMKSLNSPIPVSSERRSSATFFQPLESK